MTDFHRLEDPGADYYLGVDPGPIPAAYDYINNDPGAATGTANGERAVCNPKKPGGFNGGTYFQAWRDEGISANVNRANLALAQNTDYLDSLLRRRVATEKVDEIAVGGVASNLELTGWVWCGSDVAQDPNELVQLLTTANDGVLVQSGGVNRELLVADIQPAGGGASVIGTGWIDSPRITFTTPTVGAITVRARYGGDDSLATAAAGALTERIRPERVSSLLQKILCRIYGPRTGWTDDFTNQTSDATLSDLAFSGLDGRYRRASVEPAYSLALLDAPGAGAIINRDGVAPTALAQAADGVRTYPDAINAAWKADLDDGGSTGALFRSTSGIGSTGFVAYGTETLVRGEVEKSNSLATFMSLLPHRQVANVVSSGGFHYYTQVPDGAAANITRVGGTADFFEVELTAAANHFWYDAGGGDHFTAVVLHNDLLEITVGGIAKTFVIVGLVDGGGGTDEQKVRVCPIDTGLDSTIPAGPTACTVRWISTQWYVGQGAPWRKYNYDSPIVPPVGTDPSAIHFDGMFLCKSPQLTDDTDADATDELYNPLGTTPVLTLGGDVATRKLVSFRQYSNLVAAAAFVEKGYVQADGFMAMPIVSSSKFTRETASTASYGAGGPLTNLTADFSTHDVVVWTTDGTSTIDSIILDGGVAGFKQGAEVQLLIYHKTGQGALSFSGAAAWTAAKNGVSDGSVVYFESAGDEFISGAVGYVDWYRFINVGTAMSPMLVGRVHRLGQGVV